MLLLMVKQLEIWQKKRLGNYLKSIVSIHVILTL